MRKHMAMFLKVSMLVLFLVAFGLSFGPMMDGAAYAMGSRGGSGHGKSGQLPRKTDGGSGQHPRRTVSVSELATLALVGAGAIGGGIYFFTRKNKK